MTEAAPKPFVLQGAPRAELARLCRQICLAREQGTLSPVTAEDEFTLALTTVRATYGPGSASNDDLRDIVATEESRVADATIIAELLASRLTAAVPGSTKMKPAADADSPSAKLPTPIPFPSVNSAHPLSVADLIDGMLTQEKRDVRKPAHG